MKKRKIIVFTIFVIIISLIVTIFTINIIKNPQDYISKNNNSEMSNILSYVVLSIIQILFPFIPGEPVQLIAGYLFGKYYGTLLCFICEALGTIIVILLVRKFKKRITSLYFEETKFKKLEKLKNKKFFSLFSLLYILPGTPKDILCYFSGITNYDLIPLLIVTTIGRIPSIITSTFTAGLIKERNIIISIIIYVSTVLICAIDLLIYKKIIEKKYND